MSGTPQDPQIKFEIDCDPCINFAMQQNDVPIVRQIRISNQAHTSIGKIEIRLSSEPELFPEWRTTIDGIPPGGTHTLGPIDLRLSASYLAGLSERVGGTLRVELSSAGCSLYTHVESVEMLAFDEWSGISRSLPELLAA